MSGLTTMRKNCFDSRICGGSNLCALGKGLKVGDKIMMHVEDKDGKPTIIILVDHNLIRSTIAIPIGTAGLFLLIENSALVLEQLRDGTMLSLSHGTKQLVFRLKGSKRAIEFLENCTLERTA